MLAVADGDRKFTLPSFLSARCQLSTAHVYHDLRGAAGEGREGGNRNRLRCEVLRKSVVEQRQVSIRQSNSIRSIGFGIHVYVLGRWGARGAVWRKANGMAATGEARELVVITRGVLYRRAVLMHTGLVYAGPFIANAWRYVGVPLS